MSEVSGCHHPCCQLQGEQPDACIRQGTLQQLWNMASAEGMKPQDAMTAALEAEVCALLMAQAEGRLSACLATAGVQQVCHAQSCFTECGIPAVPPWENLIVEPCGAGAVRSPLPNKWTSCRAWIVRLHAHWLIKCERLVAAKKSLAAIAEPLAHFESKNISL